MHYIVVISAFSVSVSLSLYLSPSSPPAPGSSAGGAYSPPPTVTSNESVPPPPLNQTCIAAWEAKTPLYQAWRSPPPSYPLAWRLAPWRSLPSDAPHPGSLFPLELIATVSYLPLAIVSLEVQPSLASRPGAISPPVARRPRAPSLPGTHCPGAPSSPTLPKRDGCSCRDLSW